MNLNCDTANTAKNFKNISDLFFLVRLEYAKPNAALQFYKMAHFKRHCQGVLGELNTDVTII